MVTERPSLRQLEYLVAIDDHGTFSEAARALAVTQPALSTQIRKLEATLGVALFERRPSGVVPTAAGDGLVSQARAILGSVDEMLAGARTMSDPLTGTLRMGVIPTVAPYLLPRIMPQVRRSFPELRLLLREERTADLTELLDQGQLDLILVALESELGGVETRPLFNDPFILTVSTNHRLAGRERVSARDLVDDEVLLLDDGHCLRDQTLAICDSAGVCELGDFRATSLSTLVQMVGSGVGVTMLPAMATGEGQLGLNIELIPFRNPVPSRTLALAWRPSNPLGEHFGLLADALIPEGVEALPA